MVYLVECRPPGGPPILPEAWWPGYALIYCRIRSATPIDVRVTAMHAYGLVNVTLAGEDFWAGHVPEAPARKLIAQGRVRVVSPARLLQLVAGLVVGDDLVIR